MTLAELAFPSMGTEVRLLAAPGAPLGAARADVEALAARLTRFDPGSELCRLNADPRPVVPASPTLRAAVRVALAAARVTGGLVDCTLLPPLERAGYARSLSGRPRASLAVALERAPRRRPAAPSADSAWRRITVDDAAGTIARPPGVRLDLGGTAKGLAADRAWRRLAAHGPCAADCGGDLRVAGEHAVHVRHPLTGTTAHVLRLRDAAVATSGLDARLWLDPTGAPGHHLIDPATGAPARTGVVSATAVAPTAALAEARAKAALLAGPVHGLGHLRAAGGGLLVTDDGAVLAA